MILIYGRVCGQPRRIVSILDKATFGVNDFRQIRVIMDFVPHILRTITRHQTGPESQVTLFVFGQNAIVKILNIAFFISVGNVKRWHL